MKIYCEQCHNDISKQVDYHYEKVLLGRIKCKKCGNKQNKFISESDLYLYIGLCEIVYLFLTAMTVYVYDNMGTNLWMAIPALIIFALVVPMQKQLSRFVYKKQFKKIDLVRQKDDEENNIIKKKLVQHSWSTSQSCFAQ